MPYLFREYLCWCDVSISWRFCLELHKNSNFCYLVSSNLSLHHSTHTNRHVCSNTTTLKLTSWFNHKNVRQNLLWTKCFQKPCQIVHLQAGCSTHLTDRKDNRLHSSLLNDLRHAGLVAEANTMFFCKGSHCPPFVSFRFALFWSCKGRRQYSLLCFVYFSAVISASAGLIYESRESEEADAVYKRKWACRQSADWGWTDISTGDGPCISFQDLITGEKNVARGDAWHRDKRGEVVSVQISNRNTKGDREREEEREEVK